MLRELHEKLFYVFEPLTLESAKNLQVGVIRGSAIIPLLEDRLGFTTINKVDTAKNLVQMLAVGYIDLMAESRWVDNYLW